MQHFDGEGSHHIDISKEEAICILLLYSSADSIDGGYWNKLARFGCTRSQCEGVRGVTLRGVRERKNTWLELG